MQIEKLLQDFRCRDSCQAKRVLLGVTTDDPGYRNANEAVIQKILGSGRVERLLILDSSKLISGLSFALQGRRLGNPVTLFEPSTVGAGIRVSYEEIESGSIGLSSRYYLDSSSLNSDLHSFFRSDIVPSGLLKRLVEAELAGACYAIAGKMEEALQKEHFCLIVTLNGRHVPSKTIADVANSRSVPSFYWELGTLPGSIYFCSHPPQDYFSFKQEFDSFDCSKSQIREASKWVLERSDPSSRTNIYGKRWDSPKKDGGAREKTYDCLLATSSQDEYWSLGDIFPAPSYTDQFVGFHHQLQVEGLENSRVVLRMHPNTLNKSPGYCMREISKVRWLSRLHPHLRVFWPHEDANTYDLLRRSKTVIVSNSTLGAEAMSMGIRTIHLNPSIYATASSLTLATNEAVLHKYEDKLCTDVALKDISLQLSHEDNFYAEPTARRLSVMQRLLSLQGFLSFMRIAMDRRNRAVSIILFGMAKYLHSIGRRTHG